MKRILTDSEIDESFYSLSDTPGQMHRLIARAIEQAILEKIGEAVAHMDRNELGGLYFAACKNKPSKAAVPLYAIPFIEGEE